MPKDEKLDIDKVDTVNFLKINTPYIKINANFAALNKKRY